MLAINLGISNIQLYRLGFRGGGIMRKQHRSITSHLPILSSTPHYVTTTNM
jgi:hypothetical protein